MPTPNPPTARLTSAVAIVGMIAAVIIGALAYAGGYWENWPVLDRISGPRRFRQFVADPIPPSIRDVRGGYSGFPFGYIRTVFAYSEAPLPFVVGWTRVESPDTAAAVGAARCPYTMVFRKDRTAWLLINDVTRRGCLFVPGH